MVLHKHYGIRTMNFDEWILVSHASAGEALQSLGADASKDEINKLYAEAFQDATTKKIL